MPSAKKGKGKRGKKGGAKYGRKGGDGDSAPLDQLLAGMNIAGTGSCRHGCAQPVPPICNSVFIAIRDFFDDYIAKMGEGESIEAAAFLMVLEEALNQKNPEVWENESARKSVCSYLASVGADMMLNMRSGEVPLLNSALPTALALVHLVLASHDGRTSDFGTIERQGLEGCVKFVGGGQREALRYFNKHIPCSCLKGMYNGVKRVIPKTAMCVQCGKRLEPKLIRVCGNCKITQYCSRECQTIHWPSHQNDCSDLAAIKDKDERGA